MILMQSSENGKSNKKKKAKKDPNAPKKPLSAYMLWLQETRPSLKKKYPGASITELSKKAGEAWKGVTDKAVSWCGLNRGAFTSDCIAEMGGRGKACQNKIP